MEYSHGRRTYRPHVIQTARIPMTATALWHEIGADGAVGDWHPMQEKVDSEGNMVRGFLTAGTDNLMQQYGEVE